MATTQNRRDVGVACVLGADVLLLRRMRGSEALSQLSEYDLELYSERADLQPEALLATPLAIGIALPRGGTRHFHGLVTRFALTGRQGRFSTYQATVRPWLWFLTRSSDCRIFQERTVPEIVKAVFAGYAIADVDSAALGATYRPLPYCVQYRETDFAFVSRLLEAAGIYYYFRCDARRHTLVLADSYAAHAPAPGYASLLYMPAADHAMRESEVVYEWHMAAEVEPGAQVLKDFDFERPAASLLVKAAAVRGHAQADHELFDYPGSFSARADGDAAARVRLDVLHTSWRRVRGATRARGLFPGALFRLAEHPRADQNGEFLVAAAGYVLASDPYQPTRPAEPEPLLTCTFDVIPKQRDFRAPLATRKPLVHGPQTAIVVGKAGEEIWTDRYGRVKVQFHWDRAGRDNEASSCWVRVAQGWAGRRWGAMFVPRVGQEVIVSFLEGDPDRPLVTGSVYNADNMPPYPLPASATRSTIRSESSPGGGGRNELRFEDRKGAEQFYVHAQRDLEHRVGRDFLAWIGRDRHTLTVGDSFEETGGDRHLAVGGARTERADGRVALSGADMVLSGDTRTGLQAGMSVHIKGGTNVVIEAGASITLKAGASFLTIGPAMILASAMPVPMPSASTAVTAAVLAATILPPSPRPVPPREADDGKQ
ncbi:type VI secretion system Vgr family protein [Pseudoduganella umbonata]|uniref:Type VI secretion system secreted protein VgrG n=1 Tax=Pseudoduganella umbonata TaxID=864828 RepID=A0A4P8HL44_9BURK|nr:type VI secretion system tip protein VgrG [Pseudoduganella umbonata]MBB3221229.1 type VI secretion system secreted protein VgrG [Pseudoduganella umbonata]QCP10413.1 type VI secretion system tip protein VgrG [Pseudoduganella umbonata]